MIGVWSRRGQRPRSAAAVPRPPATTTASSKPRARCSSPTPRRRSPTVAKRAGVGISALYRRYPSKEDLLAQPVRRRPGPLHRHRRGGPGRRGRPVGGVRRLHAQRRRQRLDLADPPPRRHLHPDRGALRRRQPRPGAQPPPVRAHPGRRPGATSTSTTSASCSRQIAALHLGDAERTRAIRQRHLALALDGLRTPAPAAARPSAHLAGDGRAAGSRRTTLWRGRSTARLLERQWLLARVDRSPPTRSSSLVGLQARRRCAPYVGAVVPV